VPSHPSTVSLTVRLRRSCTGFVLCSLQEKGPELTRHPGGGLIH